MCAQCWHPFGSDSIPGYYCGWHPAPPFPFIILIFSSAPSLDMNTPQPQKFKIDQTQHIQYSPHPLDYKSPVNLIEETTQRMLGYFLETTWRLLGHLAPAVTSSD